MLLLFRANGAGTQTVWSIECVRPFAMGKLEPVSAVWAQVLSLLYGVKTELLYLVKASCVPRAPVPSY